MKKYYVHNGYVGWSYGTPGNPQLITDEDAYRVMELAGISHDQVEAIFPPAQYAKEGDRLFVLTGNNRFIFYGDLNECGDIKRVNVKNPLSIDWDRVSSPDSNGSEPGQP